MASSKTVAQAKRIEELERDVAYWQGRFTKMEEDRDQHRKLYDKQYELFLAVEAELNRVRSHWNRWTLINRGDGDDPCGTVRIPREDLEVLLLLLSNHDGHLTHPRLVGPR